MKTTISRGTKRSLEAKAKAEGKILPDNYEKIINEKVSSICSSDKTVEFKDAGLSKKSFVKCGRFRKDVITCSSDWAYEAVFSSSDSYTTFKSLIGHEIARSETDVKGSDTFSSWTKEVYCDYRGTQIALDSKRKELSTACAYQFIHNEAGLTQEYLDSNDCPSWRRRWEYSKEYDFDDKLISQIAKDVGCEDPDRIKEEIEKYNFIKLK